MGLSHARAPNPTKHGVRMPFTIPNEADAFHADQAEPDKVDIDILVAGLNGVGVVSGCAVTAQGTPDMTCAVAAGITRNADGTTATVATGNVTITAANATNPRLDLVVVSSSGVKSVTAGTAAASPVFPAIPANSVVLAAVYVPANDTAIAANQITDKRVVLPQPQPLGQPSGTLLRTYTFDSTVEGWTTNNGTLSATGGRLRLVGSDNSSAIEPSSAANVADGEIQFDCYLLAGIDIGVIVRATDAANHYMIAFRSGAGNAIEVFKKVAGVYTSLGVHGSFAIALVAGTVHVKVLVRFVGSLIDVYINESHKLTVSDTTYSTGRVGGRANTSGDTMELDNVKVYSVP